MIAAIFLVFFVMCMVTAMVTDTLTQKIPNWLNLALLVGFVLFLPFSGFNLATIGSHLFLSVIVFAVGFCLYCLKAMGAGDVKFMTATVPWLGAAAMTEYVVAFGVLGGILCIGMLWARRNLMWEPLISIPWVENWMCAKSGGVPYGLALGPAGIYAMSASPIFQSALLAF